MVAAGDGGICSRGAGRAGTVPPLVDLAGALCFLVASCNSSARAASPYLAAGQADLVPRRRSMNGPRVWMMVADAGSAAKGDSERPGAQAAERAAVPEAL